MRRSLLYDMEAGCLRCGNPNAEWHHVWNADRRATSDREGCIAPLCREHHQGRHGVHRDMGYNRRLRSDCQRRWEAREVAECGISEEEARRRFMGLFFENYIMDGDET